MSRGISLKGLNKVKLVKVYNVLLSLHNKSNRISTKSFDLSNETIRMIISDMRNELMSFYFPELNWGYLAAINQNEYKRLKKYLACNFKQYVQLKQKEYDNYQKV